VLLEHGERHGRDDAPSRVPHTAVLLPPGVFHRGCAASERSRCIDVVRPEPVYEHPERLGRRCRFRDSVFPIRAFRFGGADRSRCLRLVRFR